ncbi:MAG TPA: indolepyruvate oxidoreductase subunit beta, partial [Moorella mulderi]|nr:indolepyruvate oxidoreductase subunit beta [Moorella mulderi]
PQGWLIAADIEIPPLPVLLGRESYPPRLEEELRKRVSRFMLLPARELAASAGNPRAANMVLLGALSLFLPISLEDWEQAMEACLPPRLWEVNRRAFCLGRERASALQEENAF